MSRDKTRAVAIALLVVFAAATWTTAVGLLMHPPERPPRQAEVRRVRAEADAARVESALAREEVDRRLRALEGVPPPPPPPPPPVRFFLWRWLGF